MRKEGLNLGGEQSGHIIFADYATTGDGLMAALQALAVLVRAELPASQVCRPFEPVPQLLRSVKYGGDLSAAPVRAAIVEAERLLGTSGRLLVRKSGTEPVVRVMAEGDDAALVKTVVDDLVGLLSPAV
jgi:phosphoglucosamine mutase